MKEISEVVAGIISRVAARRVVTEIGLATDFSNNSMDENKKSGAFRSGKEGNAPSLREETSATDNPPSHLGSLPTQAEPVT